MSANQTVNRERVASVWNGGAALFLWFVLLVADARLLIFSIQNAVPWGFAGSAVVFVALLIALNGFFTLQPNEARVLVLFGSYKGTVKTSGFHWGNPFYTNGPSRFAAAMAAAQSKLPEAGKAVARLGKNKISLRARTLNSETLKVNDKRGNPIEIAAVVVWRVEDTAQAMFDVDNYENYVPTQSESALRHLASLYAYDDGAGEITLRANVDEVSAALRSELQERLGKAGVAVDEARLTHLAYAPEIAQVMLRSQQAEAVIAARQKIVHGAVSMVEMALKQLADNAVVSLDDERRASMVSNLMVVLCSESEVHPVVNTGTLYH
jgi:regulator of protease activity HflC (stomatin/prohibitin superfamily)